MKTYLKHKAVDVILILSIWLAYTIWTKPFFGLRLMISTPCYQCDYTDIESGTIDIAKCKEVKCYND